MKKDDNMKDTSHSSIGSVRRIARQIVDMKDTKRKALLKTFSSDVKCKVVEEMVNIRLERLRDDSGRIQPGEVSER